MDTTTLLNIDITSDIFNRLNGLARITERSQSRLAEEAIEEYLTVQEWQMQAILEGIETADRGEGVDFKEVKTAWEKKLANSSY
jgi:RHH-type rel operon transcriptional repressor/antitoxin RelB